MRYLWGKGKEGKRKREKEKGKERKKRVHVRGEFPYSSRETIEKKRRGHLKTERRTDANPS
jgi:hypothetical protein